MALLGDRLPEISFKQSRLQGGTEKSLCIWRHPHPPAFQKGSNWWAGWRILTGACSPTVTSTGLPDTNNRLSWESAAELRAQHQCSRDQCCDPHLKRGKPRQQALPSLAQGHKAGPQQNWTLTHLGRHGRARRTASPWVEQGQSGLNWNLHLPRWAPHDNLEIEIFCSVLRRPHRVTIIPGPLGGHTHVPKAAALTCMPW